MTAWSSQTIRELKMRIHTETRAVGRVALHGVIFGLLSISPLFAANAGTLTGSVVDSAGKPLPGVQLVVSVKGSTAGTKDAPGSGNFSAKTDTKGAFSVANLPAGKYKICVPNAQGYADPCRWSPTPISGTVPAAGPIVAPVLVLEQAAVVQVKINDDTGVLKNNEKKIAGAHILVGAWTNRGMFVAFPITSKDDAAQMHSIAVPIKTPLRVTVTSKAFAVKDDNGAAAPKDDKAPVLQAASSADSKVFSFHVTGLN